MRTCNETSLQLCVLSLEQLNKATLISFDSDKKKEWYRYKDALLTLLIE